MYVEDLSDPTTGYTHVTTLELLSHLFNTYGDISLASIADNDEKLCTPYYGTLPIKYFFQQFQEAKDLEEAS